MFLRTLATATCCTLLVIASSSHLNAQTNPPQAGAKAPASPPATANVTLKGKAVTINYSSPRLKGRTIGSDIVPYGKVWRTGANPATTLITETNLKIGTLNVPAGTYTLFTLPSANQWLFIISKKTGEWGVPYPEGNDLGRTPMTSKHVAASQEDMSISFEKTHRSSTQLHVKWGTTDQYVTIKAE